MQPEQQNYPPSNGSQQNPNVPDFFQLDPIEESKSKKKTWLIILAAVLFLVITVAAVVTYIWIQDSPKRQFYKALENMMQTSYVNQEINMTIKKPETLVTALLTSDFSRPADPKSRIDYTYSKPERTIGDPPLTLDLSGKLIIVSKDSFSSKFTKAESGLLAQANIKRNQWYKSTSGSGLTPFDIASLRRLNEPFGLVISGQFDATTVKTLMNFIKDQNVYTLQLVDEEILDGVSATVYEVGVDIERLNELNNRAAEALGVEPWFNAKTSIGKVKSLKFWVEDETNKLIKIHLEHVRGDTQQVFVRETNLGYPTQSSITEPETAIVVESLSEL